MFGVTCSKKLGYVGKIWFLLFLLFFFYTKSISNNEVKSSQI